MKKEHISSGYEYPKNLTQVCRATSRAYGYSWGVSSAGGLCGAVWVVVLAHKGLLLCTGLPPPFLHHPPRVRARCTACKPWRQTRSVWSEGLGLEPAASLLPSSGAVQLNAIDGGRSQWLSWSPLATEPPCPARTTRTGMAEVCLPPMEAEEGGVSAFRSTNRRRRDIVAPS